MKTIQSIKIMKTNARVAGVLYLIIIISGLFSELFVRSEMIVLGDAAATANNIVNDSFLFRIGFVSDLVMVISDVGVALLFYLLLKPVSQGLSLVAAFFRLAQATVLGINLVNFYLPLLLLSDGNYLTGFSAEQLNSLSLLFLNAHSYGYMISGVFFGFSCIVLGYLIFKATYFSRWLGILVVAAGISYLIDCLVNFLFPAFTSTSEILVMTVAVVSELTLCLYLLFFSIKK